MLHFKPSDMSEDDFCKLIEDKGENDENLQIYTAIKEVISFRYKLATNLDSLLLVAIGVIACFGYINKSLWFYCSSLILSICSYFLKKYTNSLFDDYEEANILIQDGVNKIAYEIWQSKNRK